MEWLAWSGDVLLVAGLWWGVGNRIRHALLLSVLGEVAWTTRAYLGRDWALTSICVVFGIVALRNWVKWGNVR